MSHFSAQLLQQKYWQTWKWPCKRFIFITKNSFKDGRSGFKVIWRKNIFRYALWHRLCYSSLSHTCIIGLQSKNLKGIKYQIMTFQKSSCCPISNLKWNPGCLFSCQRIREWEWRTMGEGGELEQKLAPISHFCPFSLPSIHFIQCFIFPDNLFKACKTKECF